MAERACLLVAAHLSATPIYMPWGACMQHTFTTPGPLTTSTLPYCFFENAWFVHLSSDGQNPCIDWGMLARVDAWHPPPPTHCAMGAHGCSVRHATHNPAVT